LAVLFRDGWLLRRVVGKVGCHRPHPQHRRKLPDTFDAQPQDKKFIMADLSTAALTQLVQQLTPPGQWLLGPAARPLCLLPSAKTVFDRGKEVTIEAARVTCLKKLAGQLGFSSAAAEGGATAALRARLNRLGAGDLSEISTDLLPANTAYPEHDLETEMHETWAAIDVTNLSGSRCIEILTGKAVALDMDASWPGIAVCPKLWRPR